MEYENFNFDLGALVRDKITGFTGIIVTRSQWLYGCNVYGLQSKELKDGLPLDRKFFDEPAIELIEAAKDTQRLSTGGPEKIIEKTNRP